MRHGFVTGELEFRPDEGICLKHYQIDHLVSETWGLVQSRSLLLLWHEAMYCQGNGLADMATLRTIVRCFCRQRLR